jgi:nicotinate dehydrogenase subunit B
MAAVIKSLAPLPDSDFRAMATYLASFSGQVEEAVAGQRAKTLETVKAAEATAARLFPAGARLFDGACSACHYDGSPLPALAFNSALHAAQPDNVLQAVLHGMDTPALFARSGGPDPAEIMSMPAYYDSLSNRQLLDLASYVRARFAPDKPAWQGVEDTLSRLRVTATD